MMPSFHSSFLDASECSVWHPVVFAYCTTASPHFLVRCMDVTVVKLASLSLRSLQGLPLASEPLERLICVSYSQGVVLETHGKPAVSAQGANHAWRRRPGLLRHAAR
jgi:hypothetical protein